MDMEEKTLERESVFEGKVIHVYRDTAQMPDGSKALRELVKHPGGVAIALEDEDGSFFMVKQWRYAQETVTLEFPAGKKEPGEDPLTTAKREISEETGYTGKDWMYLGKIYPTPAYDSEVIDLYYAKKDQWVGTHFDDDEHLEPLKMTLDELTDLALQGQLPDAKTVAIIFYMKEMRKK